MLLLGQAIETALKAFLRLHGFTEQQLKRAGHNLPKVLRLAVKFGLPKPHPIDLTLPRFHEHQNLGIFLMNGGTDGQKRGRTEPAVYAGVQDRGGATGRVDWWQRSG